LRTAGIRQPAIETAGLVRRFQRDCVSRGTGRAEIVGHAADGHDQRIVANAASGRDLAPLIGEQGAEQDFLRIAVQADHFAEPIGEMVPMRLGQVIQLMLGAVQAAGRDCVQHGLPQMGAVALNQRHLRALVPAEAIAQPRGQFQATRAAADDDDAVRVFRLGEFNHAENPFVALPA